MSYIHGITVETHRDEAMCQSSVKIQSTAPDSSALLPFQVPASTRQSLTCGLSPGAGDYVP